MTDKQTRYEWILAWLETNLSADALNAQFHEDYHTFFPSYKRRETYWGAAPVPQAMKDLRALAKLGKLIERRIGLKGNWQPGFPRHVISYSLIP